MSKWTNNGKSVYIREDLAFKTIRYTNLGVIEADEFRKILILIPMQALIQILKLQKYTITLANRL